LPPLSTDAESVLCLGGDSGLFAYYPTTLKPLFNLLSKRFKAVVAVYGNHEWYNSRTWGTEKEFWNDKKLPDNVHILHDDYIIFNDIAFIGATLWTNFNNSDPLALFHASRSMSDFECIRMEGQAGPYTIIGTRLTPEMTVDSHIKSDNFIFRAIDILKECHRTVVVTHHLPSEQSVDDRFEGDLLNYAYFTELGDKIAHHAPDLWIHGHTHSSCSYMINDTQIECNPLGYHGSQTNKSYIKDLVIDIS
jgi:Icc-related predicted phosphoesterase